MTQRRLLVFGLAAIAAMAALAAGAVVLSPPP